MRVCLRVLCLVLAGTFSARGIRAEEAPPLIEATAKPAGIERYDEKYDEYLAAKTKMRQRVAEARAAEQAKMEQAIRDLSEARARLEVPKTDSVTVDEETIQVVEPNKMEEVIKRPTVRDMYEKSPEDFDFLTFERWALNKSDFLIDDPQYIAVDMGADNPRKYFGFTFSLVNSSTQPRRIAPVILAVTNRGAFHYEVGGFLPQRIAADSMWRPLADSTAANDARLLREKVAPLESVSALATQMLGDDGKRKLAVPPEPAATFLPGQKRWGIALWPSFDDRWTELKIVVHGLCNAHRYDLKQRRVLVLTFQRQDDEFNVDRSPIHYRGKEWQYLWMWDQDISVPIPADPKDPQIKTKELTTPAGGKKLIWSFPFTLENSTPSEQTLRLKEVRFVLPVPEKGAAAPGLEVNVGGQKARVEVQVVDDGRSSIYKAQYLREASLAEPARDINRFVPNPEKAREPDGQLFRLESGKRIEGRALFDPADVDWQNVREQVEAQLSAAVDAKGQAGKNWRGITAKAPDLAKAPPIPLYDPRRTLTDDVVTTKDGQQFTGEVTRDDDQAVHIATVAQGRLEFARAQVGKVEKGEMSSVREQVLGAIPAALEAAKQKKQVVAIFNCDAGLSTGSYRVSRYYRQLGEIKEEWLRAWEELGE